jgi:hypothetical protein
MRGIPTDTFPVNAAADQMPVNMPMKNNNAPAAANLLRSGFSFMVFE